MGLTWKCVRINLKWCLVVLGWINLLHASVAVPGGSVTELSPFSIFFPAFGPVSVGTSDYFVLLFKGLTLDFLGLPVFIMLVLQGWWGILTHCSTTTNLGSRPSNVTSNVTSNPHWLGSAEDFSS